MLLSPPLTQFKGDSYSYVLGSPYEDWATELFLMHHYGTVTSLTLASTSTLQKMFQQDIPRVAVQHQFLIHAILSLAAIHLSNLQPSLSDKYQLLYRKQHHLALSLTRQALARICEDNCTALFAAASLISIISLFEFSHDTLELNQKAGDSPHGKITELISTIHGASSIYHATSPLIISGPMSALIRTYTHHGLTDLVQSPELADRVNALRSLVRSGPFGYERRAAFETTIKRLENLWAEFEDALHRDTIEPGKILAAIYDIQPPCINSLKEGDPFALIIFAHFIFLIAACESWYLTGMSVKALDIIKRTLDEDWHIWLGWPEEQLKNNFAAFKGQSVVKLQEAVLTASFDLTGGHIYEHVKSTV
jgi:Fungal specific transcription factor domain